jgi:2-polyprenyl-3-methyl-5-hydroxy-6-metoxy-1,4-benzoquinol methylase
MTMRYGSLAAEIPPFAFYAQCLFNRLTPDLRNPLSDAKIIDSWMKNVAPWTTAVRSGQIESRELITNQAIVDAILACKPKSALDLGCGEGWLSRALRANGIHVIGVDAVPALIEQARRADEGCYQVASFEQIANGALAIKADVVVCNFALLGEESVETLFGAVGSLLQPGGSFIVQTLHPIAACGDYPYRDGWRAGSWSGFSPAFTDPAPWYFRTLESWISLFARRRLRLLETREPYNSKTGQPASVIFVADCGAR